MPGGKNYINANTYAAQQLTSIAAQRIRMSPLERKVVQQKFKDALDAGPPRGFMHPANVDFFVRTHLDALRTGKPADTSAMPFQPVKPKQPPAQ